MEGMLDSMLDNEYQKPMSGKTSVTDSPTHIGGNKVSPTVCTYLLFFCINIVHG